jgi:hypothetical protein
LNFLNYASARFKDLFSNFPFRPFPSADLFFKAGSAPTEFMSLFFGKYRLMKGGIRKILIGKNVGKPSLHRYFSRSKGIAGICSFPPLIIPLPKKKGFPVGTGLHTRRGGRKGEKGGKE